MDSQPQSDQNQFDNILNNAIHDHSFLSFPFHQEEQLVE